jgi:hypothetical protein
MYLLWLLASVVAAAPNPAYILHERHEPHWSNHWIKRDAVPGDTMMPMRISLKQAPETLAKGHDILMEMYVACLSWLQATQLTRHSKVNAGLAQLPQAHVG